MSELLSNKNILSKRISSNNDFAVRPSGVTVIEKPYGVIRVTEITIPETVLITAAGTANKADGMLVYTMPDGDINILGAAMHVTLVGSTAVVADTPEVALGTTVAAGVQDTLGAVAATTENIFGPHVIAGLAANGSQGALRLSGSPGIFTTAQPNTGGFIMTGADARTIYLNIADGWANAGTVTASGKIWLFWLAL